MDGYHYQCVVSGAGTPATSNSVLLTVAPLPTVTSLVPDRWSVAAGGTINFTAVFNAGPGGSATLNGTAITSNTPLAVTVPTSATYTLTVTNAASHAAAPLSVRVLAGSLSPFAGTVGGLGEVDGTGLAARFSYPAGMVFDGGDLFVLDQGSYNGTLGGTLRKLTNPGSTANSGVVTTLAGVAGVNRSHKVGLSDPLFNFPYAVATDNNGFLYVADTNNQCIRRVDRNTGAITTVAGQANNGGSDFTHLLSPYGVAVDINGAGTGTIYIADSGNNRIMAMAVTTNTPAGTMTNVVTAGLNYPLGIWLDGAGHLLVADANNNAIKSVLLGPNSVTTVVSSGVGDPQDVLTFGGNLYVANFANHCVTRYAWDGLAATSPTVVAGTYDGITRTPGNDATHLRYPTHLATNGTDLFVADSENNVVRRVIDPTGTPSMVTLAGLVSSPSTGTFYNPVGVTVAPVSGNVYVADRNNQVIRQITAGGTETLYAGTVGSHDTTDGAAASAMFYHPQGIAADAADNLFIADTDNKLIRYITSSGTVGTIPSTPTLTTPIGICVDASGIVYVADAGSQDIIKYTPSPLGHNPGTATWTSTVLAGDPGNAGYQEGTGTGAMFNNPSGIAVDSATGTVYVADTRNNNIRAVTAGGLVSTYAGSNVPDGSEPPTWGSADGTGTAALFNHPTALALDATLGFLYVTDSNNGAVRRITLATGEVVTIIGNMTTPLLETLTGSLPTAASSIGIAVGQTAGKLYLSVDDAIVSAPF
jgi:DNA-binding beta-propeller fold protein YncE